MFLAYCILLHTFWKCFLSQFCSFTLAIVYPSSLQLSYPERKQQGLLHVEHRLQTDQKALVGCTAQSNSQYICSWTRDRRPPPMVLPPPPKPRGGGLPFVLPSSFPSSFLLSLLPSKLCQQHITTTGGRRCFTTLVSLISSLNSFCF